MSEINENDLNEEIEEVVDDAQVMTVPIDDTLSISGEAADAKAVGDAMALKADRSELAAAITVNGQAADNQGVILVTGDDTDVSETDSTKISTKLAALDAKTAADIPMSSATGAPSIAEAIEDGLQVTADEIPLTEGSQVTVSDMLTQLDSEKGKVKTVNGRLPGTNGNVTVDEVAYARNLVSDASRSAAGTFIERMSGGGASLGDGTAELQQIRGAMIHEGEVEEELDLTVNAAVSGITATIDRDTFVAAVSASGTITLSYTTGWSADPATYGVTVSGSPANGDSIVIDYVKAERGTITPASPTAYRATGWNLYRHANQYARVLKYDYRYHVGGNYTTLAFSETPAGAQTAITVTNGSFTVPADGYVHVTGGDGTTTYITPEWTDWTEGVPAGTPFASYAESVIDLSSLMGEGSLFPYGLLAVGTVYDEIDFEIGQATSRIDRWDYSATNIAAAIASGRAWEADENYIYIVRATAVSQEISLSGAFSVSDHGMETVSGTEVPVYCLILYGNNLKNKLERDVLTVSQQTLTSGQKTQVQDNLGLSGAMEKIGELGFLGTYVKSIPEPGVKLTIAGGTTAYWLAMAVSTTTTYRAMWLVCRQGSTGRTSATPILESSIVTVETSADTSEISFLKSASSSAYLVMVALYCSGSKMPEITATTIQNT